jgi:predicted transcriptional regulator
MLCFIKTLIEGDYVISIQKAKELVQHHQVYNFWSAICTVGVEYCHIFSPCWPSIINAHFEEYRHLRKSYSNGSKDIVLRETQSIPYNRIRSIIENVTEFICNTYKQHISLYISDKYVNTKHSFSLPYFKSQLVELNTQLSQITKLKQKFPKKQIIMKKIQKLHQTIGNLLSIECDSVTNIDNDVNLFTHTHSPIHGKIMSSIWSVFLNHAKRLDTQSNQQLIALAKLYHYGIFNRLERSSLAIINASMYFTHVIDFDNSNRILIPNNKRNNNNKGNNVGSSSKITYKSNDHHNIGNNNNKGNNKRNNVGAASNKIIDEIGKELKDDDHTMRYSCPMHTALIERAFDIIPKSKKKKKQVNADELLFSSKVRDSIHDVELCYVDQSHINIVDYEPYTKVIKQSGKLKQKKSTHAKHSIIRL